MRETRYWKRATAEVRANADGTRTLVGYGAVFNSYSQNLGGFVEMILPGAFDESLARGHEVLCCFNHDPSRLLGTTTSGTLVADVDNVGLRYQVPIDEQDPDSTSVARKVETGKLRGGSFTFRVMPDGDSWSLTEQGFPLRTIAKADVFEQGPVTMPAYLGTADAGVAAALRSLAEATGAELPDLVAAAGRNELRSFIPGSDPVPPTPEPSNGPDAGAAARRRRLQILEHELQLI